MSFTRRHSRPDSAQEPIVEALRAAGVKVWVIGKPCDLLTLYAGRWLPLEVKSDTSSARNRKDQDEQRAFLASTGVPVVTNACEAIAQVMRCAVIDLDDLWRDIEDREAAVHQSVGSPRNPLTAKDSQHV